MRGGRHHRRHLLGRERVVVARHPRALTRQVLHEQRQLIAQRAVQADLPVRAPTHLHALLELLLVLGAPTAIASVARSSGGRLEDCR